MTTTRNITVAQAADILGVSRARVYELAAGGTFTKRYIGTRNFRLLLEEVEEYARALPTEPAEQV